MSASVAATDKIMENFMDDLDQGDCSLFEPNRQRGCISAYAGHGSDGEGEALGELLAEETGTIVIVST